MTHHVEDMDDCLALMDQSFAEAYNNDNDNDKSGAGTTLDKEQKKNDNKSTSASTNGLWKGSTNNNIDINYYITNKKSKQQNNKEAIQEFNLRSIQIELARHKHIGELSQFLLSKCPKLRMPTFERWLIDSKMEERMKRNIVQETNQLIKMVDAEKTNNNADSYTDTDLNKKKRKEMKWKERMKRKRNDLKSSLDRHLTSSGMRTLNDYDYVIPTMADVDDDTTQRLMKEIQTNHSGDSKGSGESSSDSKSKNIIINDLTAQNICRELRQALANEASSKMIITPQTSSYSHHFIMTNICRNHSYYF